MTYGLRRIGARNAVPYRYEVKIRGRTLPRGQNNGTEGQVQFLLNWTGPVVAFCGTMLILTDEW
jgi:hypothetical protein